MAEPADPADRGRRGRQFTLLTPANHYLSRLPDLPGCAVVKLVTPRLRPARFAQYLVDIPAGGVRFRPQADQEHFFYLLAGQATVSGEALGAGAFAYLPAKPDAAADFESSAEGSTRLLWLRRPPEPWPGLAPPAAHFGEVDDVPATATRVAGLNRQELLPPGDPAFDFNMSVMSFEPGVALDQIEIHDEEHGLYLLSGGGDYLLDDEHHAVQAGDFIYMAPYCPQGFQAGPEGGAYLLYKDVYRDGF